MDVVPLSVIEQLRNQDGALFQNEKVLSVYLQVKSFVWTYISSSLRTEESPQAYLDWTDAFASVLVQNFTTTYKNVQDDLDKVIQIYLGLLGYSKKTLYAKPKVDLLLKGTFQRLIKHDAQKTQTMNALDPVKLDFIFREVFRLTLANDVLIVFETEEKSVAFAETDKAHTDEPETDKLADTDKFEFAETLTSELPDVPEIIEPVVVEEGSVQTTETLQLPVEDRAPRQVQISEDTIADTVGPPIIAPLPTTSSVISKAASALHSITSLRKPNVRTVIFDDDDNKTRISRLTRR